ncbi:Transcription factor [Coemansia sp. RSA 2711]|nr:Transcription factor [Coemansia sp. RSA 2711]
MAMPPRRRRSKLALEPNPFEESFSLVRTSEAQDEDGTGLSQPAQAGTPREQRSRARNERRHSHHNRQAAEASAESARPHSTPIDERASVSPGARIKLPPVAAINGPLDAGVWGAESLRSGPLSPAMLGGPAGAKAGGRPTPRMGVTDPALHTGLTPFLAGEAAPTAAALKLQSAVVTPGLQAMIHAAFGGKQVTATPGGTLRLTDSADAHAPPSHDAMLSTMADTRAVSSQPIAAGRPVPGGRQAKRRPASARPAAAAKRARSTGGQAARRSQAQAEAPAAESGGDDDDKRRQFLERNRVAALKCRQRKKRQIQELQERHDYMMAENERLRAEYTHMREAALHVRALLAAHSECASARANGVFGADNLPIGTPAVSMRPLLLPAIGAAEGQKAQDIIAAIPPASNGVPLHDVDLAAASHALAPLPARPPPSHLPLYSAQPTQ